MNFERQLQIIRTSPDSQLDWYRRTYPDVARLNMDPAEHYLRYGAYLGRNPGTGFDTEFYLAAHPDVAASGLNPLVHYALFGKAEGRATLPARGGKSAGASSAHRARQRVETLKRKMRSFGFEDRATREFHALVEQSEDPELAALAAFEIALAAYRDKTAAGAETCLEFLERAFARAPWVLRPDRQPVIRALCLQRLGRVEEGLAVVRDTEGDEASADLHLAAANFYGAPEDKLACINRALAWHAIPALRVRPGEGKLYDRLEVAATLPRHPATEGPKVSVLIAAYNAQDTLPVTLRALQAQTWENLEILVIDDASTDATRKVVEEFARADPRIRVETMAVNGGAYVARNHGLDLATGDLVTLNDADDWSHPVKIETQVRHLLDDPELLACASRQARATESMEFGRLNGHGYLTYLNTSSIMVRREPFRRLCGYWDPVRFSADSEMLKRLMAAAGKRALSLMETGVLSFQRQSETSITSDQFYGIEGFHYGARFTYLEAYQLHHAKGPLVYDPDPAKRHFPVPYPMRPGRIKSDARRHFDVIVASDFRMPGAGTRAAVAEVASQLRAGVSTAIVQMYRYDLDTDRLPLAAFDEAMDIRELELLAYGDRASCDLLILRHPPILEHRQRYLPDIAAGAVRVIVNQTPTSEHSGETEQVYEVGRAAENLRHYFGQDATWHPADPVMRRMLEAHHGEEFARVDLSGQDWRPILDAAARDPAPRRRGPADRLRIGRHSRDDAGKWPATPEEIRAAYPAAPDIEVHVLGGAATPAHLLGRKVPANWVVSLYRETTLEAFLATIDVFVYFAAAPRSEGIERTVLEAMAAGVPVILSAEWRDLFGDAALYTTPATAADLARRLHADPAAYAAQVDRAHAHLATNHSPAMHLDRIAATTGAGVG